MMSKKQKKIKTSIDFQFGIDGIIPSTQQAYHKNKVNLEIKAEEKEKIIAFKKRISDVLNEQSKQLEQFPTNNELFVFILQYFISEQKYKERDLDNMAKTILDLLEVKFYQDDKQVKTLLISKKIDKTNIPQNFAYIAIKELKNNQDINVLKVSGIDRSIVLYQELKSRKAIL